MLSALTRGTRQRVRQRKRDVLTRIVAAAHGDDDVLLAVRLLNRGNQPLLEFNPDGSFVAAMGEGSTIFHAAHSVRFDAEDNMWLVDAGNNVVVKFTPKRRIVQALGRRLEPWVYMTHGIERAIPAPASFYQPTDTAVGPDGSTYVTDGYGNSRVVKFTKEGNLVKYWGDRGTRPGQFNTPHSIVIDRNANLHVVAVHHPRDPIR